MPTKIRAIGALVFTVPAAGYLLQPAENPDHGHAHESHDEHSEESEEGEETVGEEKSEDEEQPEQDSAGSDDSSKSDDSSDDDEQSTEKTEKTDNESQPKDVGSGKTDNPPSGAEGESQTDDTPKEPDTPSGQGLLPRQGKRTGEEKQVVDRPDNDGSVEGVKFKGSTTKGSTDDTRLRVPDAKGGYKKRIESSAAIKLGEGSDEEANSLDKVCAPRRYSKSPSQIQPLLYFLPSCKQLTNSSPAHLGPQSRTSSPASKKVSPTPTPNTVLILVTRHISPKKRLGRQRQPS